MNWKLNLSLLLHLCLRISGSSVSGYHVDYGVGFSLGWDHGACSIYFSNGTMVDVARIEGNAHYREVMRRISGPDDTSKTVSFASTRASDWFNHIPVPSAMSRFLGDWQIQHSESAALGDMLAGLKAAAEAYIGSPIVLADFATPLRPSPRGQRLLDTAMLSARLRKGTAETVYPQAGYSAAMANGIGNYYPNATKCYETPARLVLTVDFSSSALTANLYLEDSCTFVDLRGPHGFDIGATALDECQKLKHIDECLAPVESRLQELVRLPVDDVSWLDEDDLPTELGSLVLLGDKGSDTRLRAALKTVLAELNPVLPIDGSSEELTDMADPIFAAARGVAVASWGRQNDPFREEL